MAERIEAVAIGGLGEIVPGDDLPALIADAVAAAVDVHPQRVVVAQRVDVGRRRQGVRDEGRQVVARHDLAEAADRDGFYPLSH